MTAKGEKLKINYSTINFPIEKIHGPLPKLQQADIIVVHIRKSFARYLLRKATGSYWDHVALVIFPKDANKGQYYNQIVEAVEPSGVQIHKFDKYLKDPEKYDVGIKRVPHMDPETRSRVVSFMLMNVDAPYYRYSRLRLLLAIISKKLGQSILGRQRYSCSGFVQKAFYEAANWDEREKFIFRREFLSPMELQDITTPGDIAGSNNSVWIYNKH
jgi:hypothetical protein